MTSSERKIVNCLWETKEKTHIRLMAQKANISSDYARLLCRSLARSGHIKFENDLAHLLKKGCSRFELVAANVTLPEAEQVRYGAGLTDEPAVASPASGRNDEDEKEIKEDAAEPSDDSG